MKKPLAIILAFFIVFSPVYSYAVLPALIASAASAAGRVLVGNGVKKVSQTALSRGGFSLFSICKGSQAIGCIGAAATIYDALRDKGYTVEEGDNITNNNIDIQIYKFESSDQCRIAPVIRIAPSETNFIISSARSHGMAKAQQHAKINNSTAFDFSFGDDLITPKWTETVNHIKTLTIDNVPEGVFIGRGSATQPIKYKIMQDVPPKPYPAQTNFSFNYGYMKNCGDTNDKIYLTENEFYNYLQQNISADDIKNIYNYDYSQHPNITINNNSYGGNTINNDLSVSAEPEFKVSPSLKLDIESNKVNLDNINDENCTKNEAGEYDKCGDTEEPTDPEPTDPTDPEPPKPSPIECDANGFYRKVCDWMDWTQKAHDKPEPSIVDIIDQSEDLTIDHNRINFSNQCPAPTPISTSVGGFPVSTELNYQPLCDFFTMLNPFVVGMGGISSALIIAGGARRG